MWLLFETPGVDGPRALRLAEGETTLGRDGSCDVVLADARASRRHAVLTRRGEVVEVSDAGSRHGTWVDDMRLEGSAPLRPGQRLRVGGTVVSLVARVGALPEPSPSSAVPAPVDWRPLRALMAELRRAGEPAALLGRLLEGLVELVGCDRGFVLLRDAGGALVPVARQGMASASEVATVSATVAARVLARATTVYVPDASREAWCSRAASLVVGGRGRAVAAAPLVVEGDVVGLVYLDAPDPSRLASTVVPLVETVAGFAAELLAAGDVRRRLTAARSRLAAFEIGGEEGMVVGEGPAARELVELLGAAGAQDVSVLITGETGTGKEVVARELHRRSSRCEGPFVAVNCAALPRDIVEAELFGVERGAFTGAAERRAGRFELAAGGTVFLDEVGDVPLPVQVALLRVLQERVVTRLGGREVVPLDFRLVCATNADLEALVARGEFRRDLYYRINVFPIRLLPLRARPDDVMPLARVFLERLGRRLGRPRVRFSPDAEARLRAHDWPGNVRELHNAVERALVVCRDETVTAAHLPVGGGPPAPAGGFEDLPQDYEAARGCFEEAFLRRAYGLCQGNVAAMARATGLARKTIYKRLYALGVVSRPDEGS